MDSLNIIFDPDLPLSFLVPLAIAVASFTLYGLIRRVRGAWWRAAAGALLCMALFNPSLLREDRTGLASIVPVIVDETTSQKLDGRDLQTSQALEEVRARFDNLDNMELREVFVRDQLSSQSDVSSALFAALSGALQDVPADQVGGAIFITDGQVHDVPTDAASAGLDAPLHVLLTGREDERDRRIILESAPRFGVVGEMQEIVYRAEETGFANSRPVDVTILLDGEEVSVERVLPGESTNFPFEVPHGGKNIIELRVEAEEDEITDVNNRTFTTLNGIRENLRVLLVSGEPHAGERTWRNLLKSDASVDLVHFTILRPPEKQDGTPIDELSLIAFPTRELFIQKIDEFDLIIFDRYKRRGVLPVLYFDNIARYVENGGAVMVAAGPEYAESSSIGSTPLNSVLPALASGQVREGAFKPRISENGEKHPVTRGLDGWRGGDPQWSRWFRSIGVQQTTGEPVMVDEDGEPILLLQRAGEGRVALFLSDHVWLWSRGFEGGGPHVQLLRRLAHWLMKEPELDEENLTAQSDGNTLSITRQTLGNDPGSVEIVSPSGERVETNLREQSPGLFTGEIDVDEIGLYRIANGELSELAQVGPANPRELTAVISTADLLQPIASETKGTILRVAEAGVPRMVSVRPGATSSGRGWAGFANRDASVLNGVFRLPLFTGLLGLALLLAGFTAMWLREGRQ